MKLYYAAGTCSLAAHIAAREAGIALELERVDIFKTPHRTEVGLNFNDINPKGYVPALLLDDGALLTEGVAILQYLADRRPDSGLAPPAGTRARYELQSWLTYISSELHKMYSPWLFHAEYGADVQRIAREKIHQRLSLIEAQLANNGPFLMGRQFTVVDAYLFTIVGWSQLAKVELVSFPALREYMRSIGDRPAVREVLSAERKRPAA